MTTILSEYLDSLEPNRVPSLESYECAREALRSLLFRELSRRGLWSAPPRYLGILGDRWPGDALEELVSECYLEVFVHRLGLLCNRTLVGTKIEGLIVRCVQNFVQDRQRGNDPLGYKLYELVSESLRRLADSEKIRLDPDTKIRNDTRCAFGAMPDAVPRVDLGGWVHALNDDLWPDLIVARGRARSGLDTRLDEHLCGLRTATEAFLFRDLIEPLKRDCRARWRDAVASEMQDWARPTSDPDLEDLRDCVRRRIELQGAKDRHGLHRLWVFLCDYAAGTNPSPVAEKAEKSGRPPTDLGLERALGDSRHRISGFKKTLGKMIEQCRLAAPGEAGAGNEIGDALSPMGYFEQHRQSTARALATWAVRRDEIDIESRAPRPGDLFVFPSDSPILVEWLVTEEAADGGRWVVAIDDRPAAGSLDVVLEAAGGGTRSARGRTRTLLSSAAFESARRTDQLAPEALDRIARRRAPEARDTDTPSTPESETDDDPSYRLHLAELGESKPAGAEIASDPSPPPASSSPSYERLVTRRFFSLAALLLLAIGTVFWQQSRIDELREQLRAEPYANLPFVWLTADERVRGPEDPFVLPPEARRLAIVLEISSPAAYPRYRVEVESQSPAKVIWSADGFVENDSELSFDLPSAWLSDGEYAVRAWGLPEHGEPVLLEDYPLWIRSD